MRVIESCIRAVALQTAPDDDRNGDDKARGH